MSVYDEYRSKLRTADEAVRLVKNGDWVDYASNNGFPKRWTRRWRSVGMSCGALKYAGTLFPAPFRSRSATRGLSILFITAGSARHTSGG